MKIWKVLILKKEELQKSVRSEKAYQISRGKIQKREQREFKNNTNTKRKGLNERN